MEHTTIKVPDVSTQGQARPKRAFKVTPTGPSKPEMVTVREPEQKNQPLEPQPGNFTQKAKKTRVPFEQRYNRVTTYFQKDLLQTARHLQQEGWVDSFTALVNDALREYV